jgi:hypothetical protein
LKNQKKEKTKMEEVGNKRGMTAGIIACVLAGVGILFFGVVFVPLAMIVALFGTFLAVKSKNTSAIGVNILAWVLVIIGVATSPLLLVAIGLPGS